MLKKLLSIGLVSFLLAGCAGKGVDDSHFGGTANIKKAESTPDQTPILLAEYGTSRPDSAGGVDLQIEFTNTSEKTIKYVTFWATTYNRVGDKAYDRVGKGATKSLQYIGPMEPGYTNARKAAFGGSKTKRYWDNVWYSTTLHVQLSTKLKSEYMDRTKRLITDKDKLLTREEKCRSYKR